MHDEVAHLGVVDGRLRLRLPGRVGRGVVREDADHVELRQVLELDILEALELAAEDEVEELTMFRVSMLLAILTLVFAFMSRSGASPGLVALTVGGVFIGVLILTLLREA